MQKATIFIELLDEGARVFAPVQAEHLGGRYYKVLEHNQGEFYPRFAAGTYVLCLPTKLSRDELVPLAYCEVDKEEAEYMSKFYVKSFFV